MIVWYNYFRIFHHTNICFQKCFSSIKIRLNIRRIIYSYSICILRFCQMTCILVIQTTFLFNSCIHSYHIIIFIFHRISEFFYCFSHMMIIFIRYTDYILNLNFKLVFVGQQNLVRTSIGKLNAVAISSFEYSNSFL